MDVFQGSLAVGAVIAALLALHLPRAVLWIGLGVASFVASNIWQLRGLPHHEAFDAATNFVVVLAIFIWAQRRWEMRVMNCFILMLLLDLLFSIGTIPSHFWLVVSLEVANWLALLVIGSAGYAERAGYDSRNLVWDPGIAGSLHRALHAERGWHPFARRA